MTTTTLIKKKAFNLGYLTIQRLRLLSLGQEAGRWQTWRWRSSLEFSTPK